MRSISTMLVIGVLAVAKPVSAGEEHLALAYYGTIGTVAVSLPLLAVDVYLATTGRGVTPQYALLEVVTGLGCIGLGSYVLFSNHAGSFLGAAPIALGLTLTTHGLFADRRVPTEVTVGSPPSRLGVAPWVIGGGGGLALGGTF